MSPDMIFSLPVFWIALTIFVIVLGGLVFYALHSKGDVSAEFSHGLMSLKLEAKDRVHSDARSLTKTHPPPP